MNLARLVLLGTTIASMFTGGVEARDEHDDHAAAPAALVKVVREVTEPFRDPAIAGSAGYGPLLGCVSGQQEGAMGLHLVNGGLVFDEGTLDPEQPEALMYEMRGGRLQLLGVEYIVPAAAWHEHNQAPPALLGQARVCRQHESIRPRAVLRAARVGVAGEPARHVRGLESARVLRRVLAEPAVTGLWRPGLDRQTRQPKAGLPLDVARGALALRQAQGHPELSRGMSEVEGHRAGARPTSSS